MPTRLEDASIEVRIDREQAEQELERFKAEVERFRGEQEATQRDTQRRGSAERRRGEKSEAKREESDRGRRGAGVKLKSIRRTLDLAALLGSLPLGIGTAIRLGLIGAEFGPGVSRAITDAAGDNIPAPVRAALEVAQAKVQSVSDDLVALQATVQSFGASLEQLKGLGLSIARTPAGEKLDPKFLLQFLVGDDSHGGLFEYNKLELQRQRRARTDSVNAIMLTLGRHVKTFLK